MERKKEIEIS